MEVRDISDQVLWGPALMISPFLDEINTRIIHVPGESYYDYYDGSLVIQGNHTVTWNTEKIVPLHIRPGHIIPTQKPAMTTTARLAHVFHTRVG